MPVYKLTLTDADDTILNTWDVAAFDTPEYEGDEDAWNVRKRAACSGLMNEIHDEVETAADRDTR